MPMPARNQPTKPRKPRKPQKTRTTIKPDVRQRYILEHIGLMSYPEMARNLDVSEQTLYADLREIRSERELIHHELISTAAEEQWNRLNAAARLAFDDLIKSYRRLDELKKGELVIPEEVREARRWNNDAVRNHQQCESNMTKFLQAVGAFRQDVGVDMSQTIIVQSDIPDIDTLRRSQALEVVATEVTGRSHKPRSKSPSQKKGRPIGDRITVEE